MLRGSDEPKNLTAADGLQGGEGHAEGRAAFASQCLSAQTKQKQPVLIPRGWQHTGSKFIFFECHSLKFSNLVVN